MYGYWMPKVVYTTPHPRQWSPFLFSKTRLSSSNQMVLEHYLAKHSGIPACMIQPFSTVLLRQINASSSSLLGLSRLRYVAIQYNSLWTSQSPCKLVMPAHLPRFSRSLVPTRSYPKPAHCSAYAYHLRLRGLPKTCGGWILRKSMFGAKKLLDCGNHAASLWWKTTRG